MNRILDCTMEHDEAYDPAVLIDTRLAILLAHSNFRDWAVANPVFWSHVLITGSTQIISICMAMARVPDSGFALTIRLVDPEPFLAVSSGDLYDTIAFHLDRIVDAIEDKMHLCYDLTIQAMNPIVLRMLLDRIQAFSVPTLETLNVSFGVSTYIYFRPPRLASFLFQPTPTFPTRFSSFATLHLTASDVPSPVISYASRPASSLAVHQPPGAPLQWSDVVNLCVASDSLDTLVIDGIDVLHDFSRVVLSPPLPRLRRVELNFRRDSNMALLVSRLNIPSLSIAKIWLYCDEDLECLTICSGLLRTVPEILLAGPCPVATGMDKLFGALHGVKRLDLTYGSLAMLSSLRVASGVAATNTENNWHACPLLTCLLLGNVPISDVKRIVEERQRTGYKSLEFVRLWSAAIVGQADKAWFSNRSITLVSA
jgi:hypothetical protein